MTNGSIIIKNIYYMLSYAFNILKENGYKNIQEETFENIYDLIAAILSIGITYQLKHGLNKEYITKTEEKGCITGKINLSDSIKNQTIRNKKLICTFDEFTENILFNQILKTCSVYLIKSPKVEVDRKNKLKKVMLYFSEVDTIDLKLISWDSIKYHRNNATYKMLINICYLLIKGCILSEETGTRKLTDFLNDNRMCALYENFVNAFYKKHYPDIEVSSKTIEWNVPSNSSNIEFLPKMETDITLEYNGKTLIIDTKYYNKTMIKNYDKYILHPQHLYQIFAYVKNYDVNNTGNVAGMLLYAKTTEEIVPDYSYTVGNNPISAKTLDLNTDFEEIKKKLKSIVCEYFEIKDLYIS